ncbi:hypothetical protein [Phaeobacter porticola]|uniref:Uncharacterized protein n=1 Tax=Phaeobacter porticola TaxID=1844006 RepID=A0A1L3I849_9RHOB|nr:hypothetical protein [Phaeobacter porticola]APG48231.1 hypothetical protein PhaeoP97_02854 [Phaeobacter porticola]
MKQDDSACDDGSGTIKNLELVHWVEHKESFRLVARSEGHPVEQMYETFPELYEAISELGPLSIASPKADVALFAISGEFDGHIMAVRQSGRNIRRFLVREDFFDALYGSVQNCIDHLLSNNALDCELELKHLCDMAHELHLQGAEIDQDRDYSRLEIDVTAALQHISIFEDHFGDNADAFNIFELGYSVGRLFSSAQNLVSLEPDARKAREYENSYKDRGKMGKSKDRKSQRLDQLFERMAQLVESNPVLARMKPIEVAKLAVDDAAKENPSLWSQGRGQVEMYLTTYASEAKYKSRYRELFPKTG